MPVTRRKLAASPTLHARVVAPISIRTRTPHIQPAQLPSTDQRGMNVRAASKYLGTSVWQVRKFIREEDVPSFRIGNKDMIDRYDLDALIERLKNAA